MNEVSRGEQIDVKTSGSDGYKDIKSDSTMSVKDSGKFWDDEVKSGDKVTDDNGKVYRSGNELKPNNTFEVNGYKYKTDSHGRVKSAEGVLQKKDHDGRRTMESRDKVDKGDMKTTDDRGHLIADRFNGSGGIENLVPMDAKLNQGDYKALESTLSDAVNDGAKVNYKVEPLYIGESTRPSEFKVPYSINGEKFTKVFKNGE